jgi:hypothetical protein
MLLVPLVRLERPGHLRRPAGPVRFATWDSPREEG